MFCILYKMSEEIGLNFFEKQTCFTECKFFQDNKCSILRKKENNKLTNEKFGWIVDETIYFKDSISRKNSNMFYKTFLLLIHPIETNLWMCKYYKKDKEKSYFSIFNGNKRIDFDNLESLNNWLSKTKYNGRVIKEGDFEV